VKCFDLALRFAQLGGRGEGFTDCLSIHFAGEAEVGSVAWLVWLMTTALTRAPPPRLQTAFGKLDLRLVKSWVEAGPRSI
jgi:hypothetical protein